MVWTWRHSRMLVLDLQFIWVSCSIPFWIMVIYQNRFVISIIIPLVKSKSGDLTNVNNYRAICISTAAPKILESLLFKCVQSTCESDSYQFGFKPLHSTSICTNVLKSTVDYYARKGSHVFTCFVDFSKAFDNVIFGSYSVNYWIVVYLARQLPLLIFDTAVRLALLNGRILCLKHFA